MQDKYSSLLTEINETEKMINDLYRTFSASRKISESASRIIYFLRLEHGGIAQSRLCALAYLPKQTVSSCIEKLEKEGYVEVKPSAGGKKSKTVYLTKKGEELAVSTADKIIENEQNALKAINEGELEEFMRIYRQYAQNLKAEFKKD